MALVATGKKYSISGAQGDVCVRQSQNSVDALSEQSWITVNYSSPTVRRKIQHD
jgi:hypothetical protein